MVSTKPVYEEPMWYPMLSVESESETTCLTGSAPSGRKASDRKPFGQKSLCYEYDKAWLATHRCRQLPLIDSA